jgi:ligand-binding SRPBCC domain-containing protein
MPVVELEIVVRSPIERVFDLSRSVDLHADSTRQTRERPVAGVTSGLLQLHDQVTWEATHFGVRQRLTSRIVEFDRPHHFRDSMISGAFRRFDHDHDFSEVAAGTRVTDRFDFGAPLGIIGQLANSLFLTAYMKAFLRLRLNVIKDVAETGAWTKYLSAAQQQAATDEARHR